MICNLYFFFDKGELLFEKHWREPLNVALIVDKLFSTEQLQEPFGKLSLTPPIYFIWIVRHGIYMVAVVNEEVPPSNVVDFLDQLYSVLDKYLKPFNSETISTNLVIIYELLNEMIDDGEVVTTNYFILREIIRPPNLVHKVTDLVTSSTNVLSNLTTEQLCSSAPWRMKDQKVVQNEMYFDIVETLDAIVDRAGQPVSLIVNGSIFANLQLSDDPKVIVKCTALPNDASCHKRVHSCVDLKTFQKDQCTMSFFPPIGKFKLIAYQYEFKNVQQSSIPVRVGFTVDSTSIEIQIASKVKKCLDAVVVLVEFPISVIKAFHAITSHGSYNFTNNSKLLWTIDKVPQDTVATIKGNAVMESFTSQIGHPTLQVFFTIEGYSITAMRISKVDVLGVKYKPYKGVKVTSKTGRFEVRTS